MVGFKFKIFILLMIISTMLYACKTNLSFEEEQARTATEEWQAAWSVFEGQIDSNLLGIIKLVSPVIEGQGIANAGYFDPSSPEPHKLIVLYENGLPYPEIEALPNEWLPTSLSETELVVILGEEDAQMIDSEDYTIEKGIGTITIERFQYQCDITVLEARTGAYVSAGILRGSEPPGFPGFIESTSPIIQSGLRGNRITPIDIEKWLILDFNLQKTLTP